MLTVELTSGVLGIAIPGALSAAILVGVFGRVVFCRRIRRQEREKLVPAVDLATALDNALDGFDKATQQIAAPSPVEAKTA